MKRTDTVSLDSDWLWRRLALGALAIVERMLGRVTALAGRGRERAELTANKLATRFLGQPHTADSEERGLFARSWPIGTTALWIAGLLSAYVLIYYL